MKQRLLAASVSIGLLLALTPAAFAAEPAIMGMISSAEIYVKEKGMMLDYTDGEFHADEQVSRIDFVVSVVDELYRQDDFDDCFRNIAPKLPPHYTHLFSDVHKDTWYAGHVCIAMFTGLINGNRDGSFQPHKGITTAEASKIMAKAYGFVYPPKNPTREAWYAAPMHAMRLHGAISQTVTPTHVLNRKEAAQMFFALRNVRRFPAEPFTAHNTPSAETAVAAENDFSIVEVRVSGNGTTSNEAVTTSAPTDVLAAAQTRRTSAPKISRRTLRQQVREQRMR